MSSFHIVCIGKSEFERIHCHGRVEWDQIEFETKWGNKAKFIKTAQTSHICSSPPLKSNQMEICEFHPTTTGPHLSDTICAIHIYHRD